MSDSSDEKTPLQQSRDIISQLKEMQHYSKANIEKLSGFWLLLEEEIQLDDKNKQKEIAARLDSVLSRQNALHEELETLIAEYETECNRIENEA